MFDVEHQIGSGVTYGVMTTTYRCRSCGNRTRFDVYELVRRRQFQHFTLGGEVTVEDEELMESDVERVVCRWCGRADQIEAREADDGQSGSGVVATC